MKLIGLMAYMRVNGKYLIGNNGGLPWTCKEDMKNFVETTRGKKVIVSMKTLITIPNRLKGRTVYALCKDVTKYGYTAKTLPEGVTVHSNATELLTKLRLEGDDCYVIGGGEVYDLFQHEIDEWELSEIGVTYFKSFEQGLVYADGIVSNLLKKIGSNDEDDPEVTLTVYHRGMGQGDVIELAESLKEGVNLGEMRKQGIINFIIGGRPYLGSINVWQHAHKPVQWDSVHDGHTYNRVLPPLPYPHHRERHISDNVRSTAQSTFIGLDDSNLRTIHSIRRHLNSSYNLQKLLFSKIYSGDTPEGIMLSPMATTDQYGRKGLSIPFNDFSIDLVLTAEGVKSDKIELIRSVTKDRSMKPTIRSLLDSIVMVNSLTIGLDLLTQEVEK